VAADEREAGMAASSASEKKSPVGVTDRGGHDQTDARWSLRTCNARGRYFTLRQTADEYPAFTLRLLRRLVQERRIAFSRVGRCIVLAEADIEAYVEASRVEPPPQGGHWYVAS
jgi:hypothetical protein